MITFTGMLLGRVGLGRFCGPRELCPDRVLPAVGVFTFTAIVSIPMLLSRWTVRLCLWLLAHTFYRVEVRGAENLPKRGPALLVCNHISFIDPLLISAGAPRPIRFLMSRPFYEARGIHWLAKLMGAIPVSAADPPREMAQSLDAAQVRLRAGELVCLFADSALMRTGHLPRLGPSLEGISRAVTVPVVPVHLDRVWGNIFRFERGRFFFQWPRRIPYRVTISFGAALAPSASVFQVRQALMMLSAEASSRREAVQRPLPETFLDCARRNWRRFAMADSSGREVRFGQALIGALLFRRFIVRRCPNEKMLGVLLPPSVPAAVDESRH